MKTAEEILRNIDTDGARTLSEARDSQHKLFKEVFHIYSSGDPFEDTQESVIDRILAEGYSIGLIKH